MTATSPAPRAGWARLVGDVEHAPEQSPWSRAWTALALALAVVAGAVAGTLSPAAAAGAVAVMVAGCAVAWWRRNDARPWIALAVTGITLVLVVRFALAHGGATTPAELRTPLGQLLIAMECMRTFAMRTRRELRFGLASSAAVLAVAGSASLTMAFALPLAGWSLCVAAALVSTHRSDLRDHADPSAGRGRRRRGSFGAAVAASGVAVVVAVGAFLIVPAAQSSRFLASVSRLPSQVPVPNPGGLSNPSLGAQNPSNDGDAGTQGDPASFGYFGFTNRLDTAVRGRPDDTLVMRVRASAPDFWRGQSFDTWNGREWSMSDESNRVLRGRTVINVQPLPEDPGVVSRELIQTYFLEVGGPNVIFAAARPTQVYIPQSALFQLRDGTIRTGVELESGSIYTVVSRRPAATPSLLRAAGDTGRSSPPDVLSRFASQPNVPARVAELAERVTAGQATTYDKVRAIEGWIGANTRYSLDIPPLPEGADAVEQFLFQDRIGFCEQIASSLVIMLRSQGIPARLAVGYTPGERNPFTGLYEVRARDAHAWAEVYFPTVGWQAFDPTARVPLAGEPRSDAARTGLATYLARHLGPHRRLIAALLAGLAAAALTFGLWRPAARALARRARRRNASWAERMLERLEGVGARAGRPRETGETAREYADALGRTVLPDPRMAPIGAAIERDAYGPAPLDDDERRAAERALDELAEISR